MNRPIRLRALFSLRSLAVFSTLGFFVFAALPSRACTTFCLRDSGRRGLARVADSGDRPDSGK